MAKKSRKTKETEITLSLNLDGKGQNDIDTGIGFFDHMLDSMARHGLFDLKIKCRGDLHIDGHHTVEDVGIVLGGALSEALGDKGGIARFGHIILPMDDALVLCAVDLSGRPYLAYNECFSAQSIGGLDTSLIREFFYAVTYSAGMNLHLKVMEGDNAHHVTEALFKGFGKALDMACAYEMRLEGPWSTKGSL